MRLSVSLLAGIIVLSGLIPSCDKKMDGSGTIVKDANGNDFRQIFIMELDWKKLDNASK